MNDITQLYASANIRIAELERQNATLRHDLSVAENWLEHKSSHVDDLIAENTTLRDALKNCVQQVVWIAECTLDSRPQTADEKQMTAEFVSRKDKPQTDVADLNREIEEVKRVRYCVEDALTRSQADVVALTTENAELRAALAESEEFARKNGETASAKIAELLRENAALRADKERLDWLIGEAHYLFFKELASDLAKGREQIDAVRKEAQP